MMACRAATAGGRAEPGVRQEGERDPRLGVRRAGPEEESPSRGRPLQDVLREQPAIKAVKELDGSAIGDPRSRCRSRSAMSSTAGRSMATRCRDGRAREGPPPGPSATPITSLAVLGKGREADKACRSRGALPWKAKLGPDHPDTLTSMNNLAVGYQAAGKLDKALPLFEETLALRKAKLGPDHPDTLTSMNNLASGYQAAGKLDEALPLFEETLAPAEGQARPRPPRHPRHA